MIGCSRKVLGLCERQWRALVSLAASSALPMLHCRSSLEAYNREIEGLKREMQQATHTAQAIRFGGGGPVGRLRVDSWSLRCGGCVSIPGA